MGFGKDIKKPKYYAPVLISYRLMWINAILPVGKFSIARPETGDRRGPEN
jgi:hypothetical protein